MNPLEKIFVKTFVRKDRQERALFELASESKRGKFLDRLCHDFFTIFEPRYLKPVPGFEAGIGLQKLLEDLGATKTCGVISCNDAVDGKHVSLAEAIAATVGFGLPSIIICAADGLAYFEAEQVGGPPPRYLLVRQRGGT